MKREYSTEFLHVLYEINMNECILQHTEIPKQMFIQLVKAMVFPIVMYRCESWTIKFSAEELILMNCGVGEDS